jgi:hypothetical protein
LRSVTHQVRLDRLREISRQRTFGRRMPPAAAAQEKANASEERVEWPISR